MMQKRLYLGRFDKNGHLIGVTVIKVGQAMPPHSTRISKTLYDATRLQWHSQSSEIAV